MVAERSFKQTLQDVTVSVPVPPGTRAKLLDVDIKRTQIAAKNKVTGETLFEGQLFAPINTEDSTWCVDDAKELILTLEKKNQQEWWPHVLVTDPKIDVTKLQPENSKLSDLDPETRATVEKMMFDQQQKEQGRPTSDELQKQKTLENFKKMHPELDFSQVQNNF